jgi:DNA-binding transcriptional LysR family regulator
LPFSLPWRARRAPACRAQTCRCARDHGGLSILAAIAAHGSVTKAAKHLNYSQPAVSHHLALAALIPHAAATLRREHPGIELHLADAHPQVALNLLRAGQADAAIIFRYAYTSDDVIVEQALVAAGMGVTIMPGLALRTHWAPGIRATALPGFRRRVYLATYGDPPDPPATKAFITALHHAIRQTQPGEPAPGDSRTPTRRSSRK